FAACELSLPDFRAPAAGNAVFEDLKRRLRTYLDDELRKQMSVAARSWIDTVSTFRAEELLDAMSRASARTAMLTALDPAVAISCFKRYRRMFDRPESSPKENELSPFAYAGLSFAVSAEHSLIRQRLGLGLEQTAR